MTYNNWDIRKVNIVNLKEQLLLHSFLSPNLQRKKKVGRLEPTDPNFYKIWYGRSVWAYGVEFMKGPNGFGVYATKDVEPLKRAREFQTMTSQVAPTGGAMTVKCKLSHPEVRNIVTRGTIYYSSEKQVVHGVPLKGDCYKVSIDEAIKLASFLPIQAGEHKTVGEANKSFVAWPKKLVIIESKVLEPTSDQHNENQPIADQQNEKPKHNKRKKDYTTPDGKPKHTRSSYNKMHK